MINNSRSATVLSFFLLLCGLSAASGLIALPLVLSASDQTQQEIVIGKVAGESIVDEQSVGSETIAAIRSLSFAQEYHSLQPSTIKSEAGIAIDAKTGDVLFAKNPDAVHPIASLTKLATAWLLFERGFDDKGSARIVSLREERAISAYGITNIAREDAISGVKVLKAETFSSQDLLAASLIASANNATFALVESQGLSPETFANEMALLLQRTGLNATKIDEPTGLSNNTVSTARELATIVRVAFKYVPLRELTQERSHTMHSEAGTAYLLESTDDLLEDMPDAVLGAKTGYLGSAGYTFTLLTKHDSGREIIICLLGAPTKGDRFEDARIIARWLDQNFD